MDKAHPRLPECQLPMPTTIESTQDNLKQNTGLAPSQVLVDSYEGRTTNLTVPVRSAIPTKASFRAWISSDENCLVEQDDEVSRMESTGTMTAPEELVINQSNFLDLSTLTAWEKEEAKNINRESSLTRQKPLSSLNAAEYFMEKPFLTTSPFKSADGVPFCQDSKEEALCANGTDVHHEREESNDSAFSKTNKTMSNEYVMVPETVSSEKVSLKARILWKIQQFRKRRSKNSTQASK